MMGEVRERETDRGDPRFVFVQLNERRSQQLRRRSMEEETGRGNGNQELGNLNLRHMLDNQVEMSSVQENIEILK